MDVDNFCRIMDDIADDRDKLDEGGAEERGMKRTDSDWTQLISTLIKHTPMPFRDCMVRVAALAVGAIRAYDARKEAFVAPPPDEYIRDDCAKDCYGCVHHSCRNLQVCKYAKEHCYDCIHHSCNQEGYGADPPPVSEPEVRHLIPFGEKIDLSEREEWREYIFPGDVKIRIDTPLFLIISENGHRVLDGAGISHYIPKGWILLQWKNKPGHSFWCVSDPVDHDLEEEEVI